MKQANQKIWCVYSVLTLILTLFVSLTHAQAPLPTIAGGKLYASPIEKQLYPRNLSTNNGTVVINGKMRFSGRSFVSMRRRVFRDDNGDNLYAVNEAVPAGLATVALGNSPVNDSTDFAFPDFPLPAELFNYRFQILGVDNGGQETVLVDINEVVSGDAYIIQGQSNAESFSRCQQGLYPCNPNADQEPFFGVVNPGPLRKFLRVYGNGQGAGRFADNNIDSYNLMPKNWALGSATVSRTDQQILRRHIGEWGTVMGMSILDEQDVPVCIINGAYGAPIGHFLSNAPFSFGDPAQKNNYNSLLSRVQEAGLQNNIRAIFWFQGETNMTNIEGAPNNLTTAQYKTAFNALYNNWLSDYPGFSKLFVVQVRRGCFESNPDDAMKISEAHREIVQERTGVAHLISTNNTIHAAEGGTLLCHYVFSGGYEEIGNRAYNLVKRYIYNEGLSDNNWESPEPDKADYGTPGQVLIRLKNLADTYTLAGANIGNDFRLEGGSYTITNVQLAAGVITISYTTNPGTITLPTSVSYFGHAGPALPAIYNASNIGLISFRSLPIVTGSLPVDPLSLTVARNSSFNALRWKAEANDRFERFVVERGETRNLFRTIGELDGTGQDGVVQYEFTDSKPNVVVSHYRIRAIQQDGKELFSQVVTVNNRLNTVKDFRVYPNPVAGSANATIHLQEGALATINLHDASGRLLHTRKLQLQKGNNQFSLGELLDYNPGTYIVRVVTSTETQQIRVVKAK